MKMKNNKPLLSFDEMQAILSKKSDTLEIGIKAGGKNPVHGLNIEDCKMLYDNSETNNPDPNKVYCKYKRKHCVWANNYNNRCVMPTCFYDEIRF